MDPLNMYFLLKMGIFQPAMLVYQRVNNGKTNMEPKNVGFEDDFSFPKGWFSGEPC